MTTKFSRRNILAGLIAAGVTSRAAAQFGGRSRGSGSGSARSGRSDESTSRRAPPQPIEPAEAIERELPSLRIDLKLTPEQACQAACNFARYFEDVFKLEVAATCWADFMT